MVDPQPRVLAILVAHDGATWLPEVIDALEAQTYEAIEVVAVDNGSRDGSQQVLLERLGEERVLVAERDLGFGGAIALALDARPDAEFALLVHDDLVLEATSLEELMGSMLADEAVAAVGCKLLDHTHRARLQSVGWSVDLSGRADLGLEPDERDQGQRDTPRRTLVVSTAGMLLRRPVFDAVGRFDRRYHLFRDDLDLCWRLWIAGWDVEVQPAAVGYHVRAASNFRRLGQTAFLGARYFAERNTLATLLKNYSASRLLIVLPVFFVVGMAKLVGFVATRRVGDAWQTLRAWIWNAIHLRSTLRERRFVRELRQRTDRELRPLFVRVVPRIRAYMEAIADWVAGGAVDMAAQPPQDEVDAEPATATRRLLRTVRDHPIAVTAAALLVLGIVVAIPLLQAGTIRGGELAPFPTSGRLLIEDYVASWHDAGGVGTSTAPSPAQALLGLLQLATFGRSYVAARVLVLGAVPLAWLFALRAASLVASTKGPRVAAATIYALAPVALEAIRTGQVGPMVLYVLLPALVVAMHDAVARDRTPAQAWRAASASVLVGGIAIAFEPVVVIGILVTLALLAVRLLLGDRSRAGPGLVRVAFIAVGIFGVLFPWSLTWFTSSSPITRSGVPIWADPRPLWELALQVVRDGGVVALAAGAGVLVAGLIGLLFAESSDRRVVAGLWGVALLSLVASGAASRSGADAWTWAATPLIVMVAALCGAFALGLRSLGAVLSRYDFGWRHLGAGLGLVAVLVGIAAAVEPLADEPWEALAIDAPALPQFIGVAANPVDYRVLTIHAEDDVVAWDLTGPQGPTMLGFGVTRPESLLQTVDQAIGAMVGGSDPGAAGRLALLNIRYVVVPESGLTEALDRALMAQLDLEPKPVQAGRLFEVSGYLPRASFVPTETIDAIRSRGAPAPGVPAVGLTWDSGSRWAGPAPRPGSVIVSEASSRGWSAVLEDGTSLERQTTAGLVRFDVPAASPQVTVVHARQGARSAAVGLQAVIVFLVLSLLLRPPAFATRREGTR